MSHQFQIQIPKDKIKIGLLGGSFNPAHQGHKALSLEAIKRFNLQKVIWLVTPFNPFKRKELYSSVHNRLEHAKKVSHHPKIIVSNFEIERKYSHTVLTLRRLSLLYPNAQFIWIMGVDNIMNFHRWYHYKEITKYCHIAIFDRKINQEVNLYKAQKTKTLNFLTQSNITDEPSNSHFSFIRFIRQNISSSEIRKKQGMPK